MVYESDLERRLVNQIEKHDGLCIKVGYDGWPDRLAILPDGRVVWIETKRPDGELAKLQKWRSVQLRRCGQRVETPYTGAELDLLLQDLTG